MSSARDRLQAMLYLLMRDHLPSADVVSVVNAANALKCSETVYTAKGLAEYAGELAERALDGVEEMGAQPAPEDRRRLAEDQKMIGAHMRSQDARPRNVGLQLLRGNGGDKSGSDGSS